MVVGGRESLQKTRPRAVVDVPASEAVLVRGEKNPVHAEEYPCGTGECGQFARLPSIAESRHIKDASAVNHVVVIFAETADGDPLVVQPGHRVIPVIESMANGYPGRS